MAVLDYKYLALVLNLTQIFSFPSNQFMNGGNNLQINPQGIILDLSKPQKQ